MLKRQDYLKKLSSWKDKDFIKVVTGIRRCGKSTLFLLFIDYLKQEGIKDDHIIYLNLELPDYNFNNYKELYDYIKNKIKDSNKYYVFLDELQNVAEFQKAIDGLYINKNIDLYITGSNAYLLSGELATLLSGRYIEINMLPLSFKEYKDYFKEDNNEKLYLQYINNSSFPYALNLNDSDQIDSYLDSIYNTIIIKDILDRNKLNDTSTLKNITEFLFSSIGSSLSVKKIADTLISNGRKTSIHTVENYLECLTNSYIFNKVSRYDIKGKEYLQTGYKYYTTDVTMRYAVLGRKNIDLGHILENIVYLELKRRGYKVFVGKSERGEVDFVAQNKEGNIYIQVAYSVRNEETLKRELNSLNSINDHYPKYILTMDMDPEVDFDGIRKMNVLDWLLKNNVEK